ncbi:MAG: excinuclease ABC subunit UvrC [Gammaproteobacteria bacterium]
MSSFDYKNFLTNLTTRPGVYRMLDANGNVLYVGKARNLKKRVASYFQRQSSDVKTRSMIEQVADIQITITHTENEALLLENNLIKELKPRYNILFRDDKSYPYLFLSAHQDFPRLDLHRGPRQQPGHYFGPYPNAHAVRETLTLLQKIFKIRQCRDSFFRNRSRPCLQYFIKRCTAPCVGYIDAATYQRDVRHVELFLAGKSSEIIEDLGKKMEQAATALNFEEAAHYRDQIIQLRRLQEQQHVMGGVRDVDAIAIAQKDQEICIEVFFIRAGRLIGNKPFFFTLPEGIQVTEALATFLPQYYLTAAHRETIPSQVILDRNLAERDWIAAALSEQLQHKITLTTQARGQGRQWLNLAATNAQQALASRVADKTSFHQRFIALQTALHLTNLPQRIECFDISHTMGEATVASCVVFDINGPIKNDYRRFNIQDIQKGDDYAALYQAITRRYARLKAGEGELPDLLMIDGGKGQLSQGEKSLEEVQISGVTLLAVAKGPERKPGLETLFLAGRDKAIHLPPDDPGLHLIQQIRDEAHRFAITGHRQRRAKARSRSVLEDIPGIGAKRRRDLLRQFGGLQELRRASVTEFTRIPGISEPLAKRLYAALHDED